jgi:hypothetical protein
MHEDFKMLSKPCGALGRASDSHRPARPRKCLTTRIEIEAARSPTLQ